MSTRNLVVLGVATAVFLVLRFALGRRAMDATWLLYARVPLNAIGFRVRRLLGWRRGRPVLKHEPKDDLFDYADAKVRATLEKRERALRDRYELEPLAAASTREVYRDNLYVLDLLDRFVTARASGARARGIDVGSKDFRYAFALERFLGAGGPVELTGVEIDGHTVYSDLHSRADHAEAFAAQVEGAPRRGREPSQVRYRVADFLAVEEPEVDVVFFFFPFVLRYALVRWGLPMENFAPEKLFAHAARALRPGGVLVSVNQTAEETAAQRAILEGIAELEIVASEPAASLLVAYHEHTEDRTLTVARRR